MRRKTCPGTETQTIGNFGLRRQSGATTALSSAPVQSELAATFCVQKRCRAAFATALHKLASSFISPISNTPDLSIGRPPAGQVEHSAGAERAIVRTQPRYQGCGFFRAAEAAHR